MPGDFTVTEASSYTIQPALLKDSHSYSERLPIAPVRSSPIDRHYSGHRHYVE